MALAAINTAMKGRDYTNFIYHLSKAPRALFDKEVLSKFFQEHRDAFARFIVKRKPNKQLDKLNPKEWKFKWICQKVENTTIYEIRRNPKKKDSLLLGYLRMEKLEGEKTYVVQYMATSNAARGKCLAYLILSYAIRDVLADDPTNQVVLQDESHGVGAHLYENVGQYQQNSEFQVSKDLRPIVEGGLMASVETWFTYTN